MVNINCDVMNAELTLVASRFQPENSGKVGIDVAVNQVFVKMNARLLKARQPTQLEIYQTEKWRRFHMLTQLLLDAFS